MDQAVDPSQKNYIIYPVVRRELRSYGYSYSLLNGELRSYQEFPNHILDNSSL
jgi:hypothetical protein